MPGEREAAPDELAPIARLALDAALEALPAPALVLGPGGRVCHANALARGLLAAEPASMAERLAAVASGAAPRSEATVTPLEHDGHVLAVLDPESAGVDGATRATAAAVRWGLSDRQRQVLELLAGGRSNRAIAEELGCAVGTVEQHVSAILTRAGVSGRAELVARVWTGT